MVSNEGLVQIQFVFWEVKIENDTQKIIEVFYLKKRDIELDKYFKNWSTICISQHFFAILNIIDSFFFIACIFYIDSNHQFTTNIEN
jgi:hypothetical protein